MTDLPHEANYIEKSDELYSKRATFRASKFDLIGFSIFGDVRSNYGRAIWRNGRRQSWINYLLFNCKIGKQSSHEIFEPKQLFLRKSFKSHCFSKTDNKLYIWREVKHVCKRPKNSQFDSTVNSEVTSSAIAQLNFPNLIRSAF